MPDAVVVAPDEGALKLADRYATALGLPLAFVRKRRLSGDKVCVEEVVGDVRGRQVVLVDDMVSTGGTIAGAIAAVLERGSVSGVLVAELMDCWSDRSPSDCEDYRSTGCSSPTPFLRNCWTCPAR